MKVSWRDDTVSAQKAANDMCAALVYGPNRGKADSIVAAISEAILGENKDDPFARFSFNNDDLEKSPHMLLEEAASLSFTGVRKLIKLRNPAAKFSDFIAEFLAKPMGNSFILVICEDLPPSSGWRKLFEKAANAGIIACYIDERSVAGIVRAGLQAHSIRISDSALRLLSEGLAGRDDGVIRMEVEKLALYAADSKNLEDSDVRLLCHSGIDPDVEALIISCLAGRGLDSLDTGLNALYRRGIEPIVIVRVFARNVQRLMQVKQKIHAGSDSKNAMKSIRLFYKHEDNFERALRIWDRQKIYWLLLQAQTCENEIKLFYGSHSLVVARLLQKVTAMAKQIHKKQLTRSG